MADDRGRSDLIISGGGSTQVAPDSFLSAERALAALSGRLTDLADELSPVLTLSSSPDAVRLAHKALGDLQDAATESAALSRDLATAAERYGAAERAANSYLIGVSEVGGWMIGRLAPVALAGVLPALPALLMLAAGGFASGSAVSGGSSTFLGQLGALASKNAGLLRDPRAVALVRQVVSSTDDAMLGAAGVPLPLARLADDRRTGAFGLHGAARAVTVGASMFGMLRETPVRVERTAVTPVEPPSTYSELAQRIPPASAAEPQVRVERYAGPDGSPDRYIVYVGGTVDTSPVASDEPFDVTGDLAGVAGLDAGSARATELALQQAGAQPGDTVIPVGYSQGGIVATGIATSGEYTVPALVTFGSPTGGIDVPSGTVDVAVEHTDDIIPALGGDPREFGDGGGDRILVRRQTYSGAVPLDSSPIAGHQFAEYQKTADEMDLSTDARLASALGALPAGVPGEAGLYRGIREARQAG